MLSRIALNFVEQPRLLLLLDAFGALATLLIIVFVIIPLESLLGIPANSLKLLAALPALYIVFDLYAQYQDRSTMEFSLKLIAIANLFYCLVSLFLGCYHGMTLSVLAWLYICIEILIIVPIALIELKTSTLLNK